MRSASSTRLESLPCPTVAIVNGFALGGGFELALACRYRVGVKGDKLSVGLAGSDARHPSRVSAAPCARCASRGVRTAMQMMLTGKTLRADQAKRAGFFDRLVFPADAEAAARELIARQPKPRRAGLLDRLLSLAAGSRLRAPDTHGAGARQGAARTLPGALRHHRSVVEIRRAWRARLPGRSTFHRRAHGGRNLAQPGARVHAAGSAQESGRQDPTYRGARARGRRRRHGWRHRRLVRAARTQRDACRIASSSSSSRR